MDFGSYFGRDFRRLLAEIFGGFWPKFSEAILGEIWEVEAKKCSNIYNFDQIFKLIFQEESIQKWIILTIYSNLFKTVDNFDQIFKLIS